MKKDLREMRKAVPLTQCEAAKRFRVSQAAVSQWERGDARPDIGLVSEISRTYGVSEKDIITAVTAAKEGERGA